MKNFTSDFTAKAKAAKSVEELLELAKANNVSLTEAQAKTYFEEILAKGAVNDDDLDLIVGGRSVGGNGVKTLNGVICPFCGCETGVISYRTGSSEPCVKCASCQRIIQETVRPEGFESK